MYSTPIRCIQWLIICSLLGCLVGCATQPSPALTEDWDQQSEALIRQMTLEEKTSQLLYNSKAIGHLDIPAYNWWNECLHGVARLGRATVFPQPIGLAATFDEDLLHRVATVISDEARAKFAVAQAMGNNEKTYTGLTFWTPNINIFRDPRWGRGMETYGEDPYLTSRMGVAFVKGLQGNQAPYLKTAACAKHYAIHSGPEGDRHHFNAAPPKRDMYNTYLPAFEALVREAKVEAVMCAFTRAYGAPCCGSPFLLKEILRDRWGFKGHILSDCGAINDFHTGHKITQTQAESAALALKSGVSLNCGTAYQRLAEAVKQGLVSEEEVDQNLKTLYRTRHKLGLMGTTPEYPYTYGDPAIVECPEHRALAHEAALKSIVLLKNKNHTLPLAKDPNRMMVIGPTAADIEVLLGNYCGQPGQMTTIVEGIAQKISLGTSMEYQRGFLLDRDNVNKIGWSINQAKSADVTIVVMGLSTILEGEEGESIASPFKSDRQDIKLPPNQIDYLKKIRNNKGRPLVVVLTGGSPMAIPEVYEIADAVLFAWYPGQEGGLAVADILFGDAVPSGRLPVTFPTSVEQLPPYDDYAMEGRTYRYMTDAPLLPFGFGLSYTQFLYSDIQLNVNTIRIGESAEVTVSVTNTGSVAADEVVQLYIMDREASLPVAELSLRGFKRVHLAAGESHDVCFTIASDDLSTYNDEGQAILEPGTFDILIGGSCPIKRSQALGASAPVSTQLQVSAI